MLLFVEDVGMHRFSIHVRYEYGVETSCCSFHPSEVLLFLGRLF